MQNQTPPDKPSGSAGDAPGGTSSASISHQGATTLSSSATLDSPNYSSTTGGENALLVTDGEITLETPVVTKTGDESSENSDFYGTNAAVLTTGGSLIITGGSITTKGSHANALFAYGESSITATNTQITTTGNNSGGIMVTGGGAITASGLIVETSGNSSAPIRSDRGGGGIAVNGGSYTSNGVGSPAIYSTAIISVNNATLVSNKSEGVVIEGSNSVSLSNGTTLTATNTTLNGNSETYKNIFIYQSMSGDAEEGTGNFAASDSTITTNAGDTFYITNTTAKISLANNKIINNDASSVFLRAEGAKWGTSGANGGDVSLLLSQQVVEGDIVLDNISTLELDLTQSYYMGAINAANTAKSVSVTLDTDSNLILAGDTYLTQLTNADTTNQNIYSNGYKLYVSGEEVAVNGSEAPEAPEIVITAETTTDAVETIDVSATECANGSVFTECSGQVKTPIIIAGVALVVIIVAVIAFVIYNKKKKTPKAPENPGGTVLPSEPPASAAPTSTATPPDSPVQPEPPAPTA
ncbi:hypothetical protein IJI17_03260 [Candidatus Saccharibacteria bacterium]|nr:hypothetical protein [Candidatus Saccharibacteria bacterium]